MTTTMRTNENDHSAEVLEDVTDSERVVGRIKGDVPGPTLIVMTAIHGNEPTGLIAARRVLQRIEDDSITIRGEIVVLAGNLPALRDRMRYIDDDLNRQWTPMRIAAIRDGDPEHDRIAEDGQRRELLEQLSSIVADARGQVLFVDLHTSSADGAPFLTVGDTLRNRQFALQLPLPIMLGLEEQVDGSLLEYLNNYGFITIGVEAGQHDAPSSAARHESVLWLAAEAAGLIAASDLSDLAHHRALLRDAARNIPAVLEVRYRHVINAESDYRMEPGWVNFDPVRRGTLLGHDHNGPVHAPESGRMLLPLYQGKGDDGFFIAREFSRFWLVLSALLRRGRLSGLLRYLPGIRRHPDSADGEVLVVSTRVARVFPLQIFHLFGYRKLRHIGTTLVVSRRRFDLAPPTAVAVE